MSRRVALLGISGAGKSTLIARLNEIIPVLHLQASALIKAEQARDTHHVASSESLRTGPIVDNQALLMAAFKREAVSAENPIILDGHSVIDGRDGLVEIPSYVFAPLGLDAICFLWVAPEQIADRRLRDTTRERPMRTAEMLAVHQIIAKDAAERIASDIQSPFFVIGDDGLDLLVKLLG
jgi:adenylate kinase